MVEWKRTWFGRQLELHWLESPLLLLGLLVQVHLLHPGQGDRQGSVPDLGQGEELEGEDDEYGALGHSDFDWDRFARTEGLLNRRDRRLNAIRGGVKRGDGFCGRFYMASDASWANESWWHHCPSLGSQKWEKGWRVSGEEMDVDQSPTHCLD